MVGNGDGRPAGSDMEAQNMTMRCEIKLYQDLNEFNQLLELAHDARSYLEIGSHTGGSLWKIANAMPKGSRVVSVDLPNANGEEKIKPTQAWLEECVDELRKRGYDVHLFIGDSTDQAIIQQVRHLGPFDLCFIDGNHTEPYVRMDWEHYGPMSRVVAFHDIAWPDGYLAHQRGMPAQVGRVWQSLKDKYKSREIISQKGKYGIGVLWV